MADIHTQDCDVCHTVRKGNESGWWRGSVASNKERIVLTSFSVPPREDGQTIVHLCGAGCVQKWIGQQVGIESERTQTN
jgi:hypothetical protein